jgi:hypothetical protein
VPSSRSQRRPYCPPSRALLPWGAWGMQWTCGALAFSGAWVHVDSGNSGRPRRDFNDLVRLLWRRIRSWYAAVAGKTRPSQEPLFHLRPAAENRDQQKGENGEWSPLRSRPYAAFLFPISRGPSRGQGIQTRNASALIPIAREIFWGPMAYAMMGGIIVGTVLTLLFLPALYVACRPRCTGRAQEKRPARP